MNPTLNTWPNSQRPINGMRKINAQHDAWDHHRAPNLRAARKQLQKLKQEQKYHSGRAAE